ncbi:MAG: DegT/DnrJ/EryC1/StrS family aminotransferase [Pseudomonadota bacterium]
MSSFAVAPPEGAPRRAIDFVDLKSQYQRIKPDLDRRLAAVLAHGAYINGPEIAELEAALGRRAGGRHAVCVGSGTEALQIALIGDGIGPGDAVFIPGFTYMATANAVMLVGATPIFVDVDARTLMIDPEALEAKIEEIAADGNLQPRAVIPVDLFGFPADYRRLLPIAERHGLLVVADAAQSVGATAGNQAVGALAPVTASSFYPAKPLGCYGDGGVIFTDDEARAARWRSIRTHGTEHDKMRSERLGMNSRLDTMQAAVLLAKLEIFDDELKVRAEIARHYDARLGDHLELPARPSDTSPSWAVYTILTPRRDQVLEALRAAEIPAVVYYTHPLHKQPAYQHLPDLPDHLPVCEDLSTRSLSLPIHPYLDEASVERICEVVIDAHS